MQTDYAAWAWTSGQGLDGLTLTRKPLRQPGPGQVLVANRAIALNPVDWKIIEWGHPAWSTGRVPGVDGMAFLAELAGRPHAPVVVVSSSTQDKSEQAIAAVKSGAIACFDKSRLVNDADRFVKVLRRVVGARDKAAA